MRKHRRDFNGRIVAIEQQLAEISRNIESIQQLNIQLDGLIRELHSDSWNAAALRAESIERLLKSLHSDSWAADESRALSFADAVTLSLLPRIELMKRELMALVGEKAVEVFRGQMK